MASAAAESASPIGIANLPNQRHKIVAKRGAGFTIMVGPHRDEMQALNTHSEPLLYLILLI